MATRLLRRIGGALLVLIGAGCTLSVALALVPDPTDASFLERTAENARVFFTFDYADRMSGAFPLLEVLVRRGTLTFLLIGGGLMVTLLVGIPTGVLSALKPHNRLLRAWSGFVHMVSATPVLVVGIFAMLLAMRLFGVPPYRQFLSDAGAGGTLLIYLLPLLTLAVGDSLLSDVTRTMQMETTRLLDQDYFRAIRARNVGTRYHLARGLLAPTAATVASKTAYLIGGSVVVEYMFGWPGLGVEILDILSREASVAKDYPFILAATTLFVGLTLLLNLISDAAALASDPRLRTARVTA